MTLSSPFPYFGGKSRIADEVWQRLGNVPNYVEPFFGSGAVLLARPDWHGWEEQIETVNDADGMISNYWSATKHDPAAVARWADWIVSECDLHARHLWLLGQRDRITDRLMADPDWFDAKAAGWWLWGICQWIGAGWCSGKGPWQAVDGVLVKAAGLGIIRQLPHLGSAGMGINRQRRVRVCCGDWSRVCGPSPTFNLGLTGVFLDPPYAHAERADDLYTLDHDISTDVRAWALANGDNPLLRIALCGYDGEHDMPADWVAVAWKTKGGYGNQGEGRGRDNSAREVIWFSPHCLRPSRQMSLFGLVDESIDEYLEASDD